MAKTEDEKLAERLKEIADLVKQKADIDARLKELTGVRVPKKENGVAKPDGFVLTDAIKTVLLESGTSMNAKEIVSAVGQKYSFYPDLISTRSTAKYLVKQMILSFNEENKTYSLKNI